MLAIDGVAFMMFFYFLDDPLLQIERNLRAEARVFAVLKLIL